MHTLDGKTRIVPFDVSIPQLSSPLNSPYVPRGRKRTICQLKYTDFSQPGLDASCRNHMFFDNCRPLHDQVFSQSADCSLEEEEKQLIVVCRERISSPWSWDSHPTA